jgi:hypothetical protein
MAGAASAAPASHGMPGLTPDDHPQADTARRALTTPPPVRLAAGPLTCLFDPVLGAVRYVRLGDREILRSIYGAVRDRSWNTIAPRVHSIVNREAAGSTTLTYRAAAAQDDIHFVWDGRIECGAAGTIRVTFDGEAHSTFWRNRIGLCVLHPLAWCAGRPCAVTTGSGLVHGSFPALASPHQVFLDIAAVEYDAGDGCRLRLAFEGDVFEMEDQRNWGDASFKTYSGELARPMPVEVPVGTRISQAVTVSLVPAAGSAAIHTPSTATARRRVSVVLDDARPLPGVGLSSASHAQPLSTRETARLRALRLAHLRTEVRFASNDWDAAWLRAVEASHALDTPLQVSLLFSEDHERDVARFVELASRRDARIELWIVLEDHAPCTTGDTAARVAARLSAVAPGIPVAVGTAHNFAELNRNRDVLDGPWWPSFSLFPLAHLPDTLTMIENIGAQGDMVRSVRTFSPHPVVVGPVGLRSHRAATDAAPGELPAGVDPRQPSRLAAGWTIGSLGQFLRAEGLHSVTYYETTGWRGVIECEAPAQTHSGFPSSPGIAFPLYHVFADLAGAAGTLGVDVSHPLDVAALALAQSGGGMRVLVANLTPHPLDVEVAGLSGTVRARVLDESMQSRAGRDPEGFAAEPGNTLDVRRPLELPPWSLARLDQSP